MIIYIFIHTHTHTHIIFLDNGMKLDINLGKKKREKDYYMETKQHATQNTIGQ